jgi:hypothetical protein
MTEINLVLFVAFPSLQPNSEFSKYFALKEIKDDGQCPG